MEQRRPGSSDRSVSVFGLGTMTVGAESDEATFVWDRLVTRAEPPPIGR